MIRVVMVEKANTKDISTDVFCDLCGKGVGWESKLFSHFVGIARSKSILREKGWKFGKVHRCPECLSKKVKGEA